jgi:hypothetical protein
VLARLETRGAGDLIAPLAAIVERLRRTSVTVATTHPQGGRPIAVAIVAFDVQWIVSNALGDPRALVTPPSAVREMQSGDFRRVARIAVLRRERSGVQSAMKMMMDLSSGASPERRMRIDRASCAATRRSSIGFRCPPSGSNEIVDVDASRSRVPTRLPGPRRVGPGPL